MIFFCFVTIRQCCFSRTRSRFLEHDTMARKKPDPRTQPSGADKSATVPKHPSIDTWAHLTLILKWIMLMYLLKMDLKKLGCQHLVLTTQGKMLYDNNRWHAQYPLMFSMSICWSQCVKCNYMVWRWSTHVLIYLRILREPGSVAWPKCMQVWNPIKSLAHVIAMPIGWLHLKLKTWERCLSRLWSKWKISKFKSFSSADMKIVAEVRSVELTEKSYRKTNVRFVIGKKILRLDFSIQQRNSWIVSGPNCHFYFEHWNQT